MGKSGPRARDDSGSGPPRKNNPLAEAKAVLASRLILAYYSSPTKAGTGEPRMTLPAAAVMLIVIIDNDP
jgi:hypothetical protein